MFDNSDAKFSRNNQNVNDWTVVDTAVVYAFKENIDFQITVDNLFDEENPTQRGAADADIVTYSPNFRTPSFTQCRASLLGGSVLNPNGWVSRPCYNFSNQK